MIKYKIRFEVLRKFTTGTIEYFVRNDDKSIRYFEEIEEAVQTIKIMKQLKWHKNPFNDKIIDIEHQEFIIDTVVV